MKIVIEKYYGIIRKFFGKSNKNKFHIFSNFDQIYWHSLNNCRSDANEWTESGCHRPADDWVSTVTDGTGEALAVTAVVTASNSSSLYTICSNNVQWKSCVIKSFETKEQIMYPIGVDVDQHYKKSSTSTTPGCKIKKNIFWKAYGNRRWKSMMTL